MGDLRNLFEVYKPRLLDNHNKFKASLDAKRRNYENKTGEDLDTDLVRNTLYVFYTKMLRNFTAMVNLSVEIPVVLEGVAPEQLKGIDRLLENVEIQKPNKFFGADCSLVGYYPMLALRGEERKYVNYLWDTRCALKDFIAKRVSAEPSAVDTMSTIIFSYLLAETLGTANPYYTLKFFACDLVSVNYVLQYFKEDLGIIVCSREKLHLSENFAGDFKESEMEGDTDFAVSWVHCKDKRKYYQLACKKEEVEQYGAPITYECYVLKQGTPLPPAWENPSFLEVNDLCIL